VTTIREIRPSEALAVTELYLDYCRGYNERDAEWGVPERGPIERWISRTTETEDAVCLVPEVGGAIVGFLLASLSKHPAMPGISGQLEELYIRPGPDRDELRRRLVESAISWARERGANVMVATVALDSPWTGEEMVFWGALGFENDTAEVKRYYSSQVSDGTSTRRRGPSPVSLPGA
jgi:GNAT superfamily N-acetyltransferase